MKVANNMEINRQQDITRTQEAAAKKTVKLTKSENSDKAVDVAFSAKPDRKTAMTLDELNSAIQNVLASHSTVSDVMQAEEMIREARKNILKNSDEAILAQANQTAPMVAELTK